MKALLCLLLVSCLPAQRGEMYRKELDACYDKHIGSKDKLGYQKCHCEVNARIGRDCPFMGDAGHD